MVKEGMQEELEKALTFVLQSAATIINDEAKLNFKAGEYRVFDLHLSPTVYELLKRFEFTQQKHGGEGS